MEIQFQKQNNHDLMVLTFHSIVLGVTYGPNPLKRGSFGFCGIFSAHICKIILVHLVSVAYFQHTYAKSYWFIWFLWHIFIIQNHTKCLIIIYASFLKSSSFYPNNKNMDGNGTSRNKSAKAKPPPDPPRIKCSTG